MKLQYFKEPKFFTEILFEITDIIKKELKHCDCCLFYELIYIAGDLGEYHDHCVIPYTYNEMNKKFTCENWVYYKDRTYLTRILAEIKKVRRNRIQNKKVEEAIEKYNKYKEKNPYIAFGNLIDGLLRAIRWEK